MADLYHTKFTRFEHPVLPNRSFDEWRMVPVQYLREWQWPKNASPGEQPTFKTVRVSEHRWPIRGAVSCDIRDCLTTADMWPARPECADGRDALIAAGLLLPWWMLPICPGHDALWLDETAENVHARGCRAPRGLPDDYLEFWLLEDADYVETT